MPNSPLPDEQDLNCFARFVEEYIRARGLHERPGGVVLGGCSMGGAVSLTTAIRQRVALRGLILLGSFGNCRHLPAWQRLAAPLARWIPLGLARRAVHILVAKTHQFGRVSESEADWLVTTKAGHTSDYFARAVCALTRQNQIDAARKLSLATLVVHGTDDRVLPYAAGKELAEAIPGARLVTIEDSGHALFFTDYAAVNAAIAKFLCEVAVTAVARK
jgi:3-oxoadipate enol-lactonase